MTSKFSFKKELEDEHYEYGSFGVSPEIDKEARKVGMRCYVAKCKVSGKMRYIIVDDEEGVVYDCSKPDDAAGFVEGVKLYDAFHPKGE